MYIDNWLRIIKQVALSIAASRYNYRLRKRRSPGSRGGLRRARLVRRRETTTTSLSRRAFPCTAITWPGRRRIVPGGNPDHCGCYTDSPGQKAKLSEKDVIIKSARSVRARKQRSRVPTRKRHLSLSTEERARRYPRHRCRLLFRRRQRPSSIDRSVSHFRPGSGISSEICGIALDMIATVYDRKKQLSGLSRINTSATHFCPLGDTSSRDSAVDNKTKSKESPARETRR